MDRSLWRRAALPLLLAYKQSQEDGGPYPLDRIRMQKAVFLLVQRGAPDWRNVYDYRPYNWGPYCKDLADDVSTLIRSGLMRISMAGGASSYGRYVTTDLGDQFAIQLLRTLDGSKADFLDAVHSYVTHKDFNGLLKEVYEAYPDFASRSKWTGKR